MTLRRFLALGLILCLAATAGCGPAWKKKFIRRRKNVAPPQAILTLQPDYKAILPAADRYREHYAYWKSWHGELLLSLGQIHKRDVRYLDGAVGELRSMQALLSGPPERRMKEILLKMNALEQRWESAPPSWQMPASDRTELERLEREIGKSFHYSKVKGFVVQERR